MGAGDVSGWPRGITAYTIQAAAIGGLLGPRERAERRLSLIDTLMQGSAGARTTHLMI
ncbi:hypothetical protein ACU8KH_01449 [Lachancea thermotolerans]